MDAQSSMMARERQEGEKKCVFTRNDSITQILLCVAQLGNRCTHRHFSPFPIGNLIYSFVFFFFFFLQVHQLRRSLSFARSLTSWRFPSLNSEPMSIRRLSQRRIIFHLRSMKCAIGWTPCFDWFLFFSLSPLVCVFATAKRDRRSIELPSPGSFFIFSSSFSLEYDAWDLLLLLATTF